MRNGTNKHAVTKAKLDSLTQKIEENQAQIKEKRKKEKRVVNKLGRLRRDIYVETRRLRNTESKLTKYRTKVVNTTEELSDIQAKHTAMQQQLDARLVAMYKNTNLDFLEFIFSLWDYAKALNHRYIFENNQVRHRANQQDASTGKTTSGKKQKLIHEKNTIESLKKNIVRRKKALLVQNDQI